MAPQRAARNSPATKTTEAVRSPAKARRASARWEETVALIHAYRKKIAMGAKFYAQGDELFQEIRTRLKVGRRRRIADGLYVVLVDRFEEEDRVWQSVAARRYELQIQDSGGKLVRFRDRRVVRG